MLYRSYATLKNEPKYKTGTIELNPATVGSHEIGYTVAVGNT